MSYEFTDAYKRSDKDFYVEPRWTVECLIKNVAFFGAIHDPACGSGTIPKTFADFGFGVSGSDLRDRDYGKTGIDFFKDNSIYDNIVSNPPYNFAEPFIRKALSCSRGRVAILARIAFLNGQRRYKLYSNNPPEAVIILSRRPSMPPGGLGITAEGGKTDFCWIVWNSRSSNNNCRIQWAL